jgi:integrase
MARPRTRNRQLPSYCYRDKRSGSLYMLVPAPGGKLQRRTYGDDMHRMMADWTDTWGAGEAVGQLMGNTMDTLLGQLSRRRAKGDIAESTELDYRKQLSSLRVVWGRVRWADFDAGAISRWQEARGAESVVQCNRELTLLSMLAKLAGRLGLIQDNPLRFIDRLKERPRDRYVTDAEFATVFEHALPVVRAAMFIASITGLRQGDILRLRRADFGEAGLLVQTRKTGQPLLFAWSDGLRQAYEMGRELREFASLHWLVTEKGKPYTGDGFRSLWHDAMVAARKAHPELQRFTFNDLRAKAGTESRDWKILGHLDQRTFERVYQRQPRKVEPTR